MQTSRLARFAVIVGAVAAICFVGPPLAIQTGVLNSLVGFPIFMLGGLLGLIALILGLAGLFVTRPATGRPGRSQAVLAALVGAAILAGVAVSAGPSAGLPPINDITTDPADPPEFTGANELAPNRGRDMSYPGESFASQQRAAYPDLGPIELGRPPATALAAAADAMTSLGWEVTHRDPSGGTVEATITSKVFRFVDDVVVRVRPSGTGSRVDVRAKSREGRGDLGANAAHIRKLRDALRGTAS